MSAAYRTHPVHHFPWATIQRGYGALAARLAEAGAASGAARRIVIDGFSGVRWEPFVESLAAALRGLGLQPRWFSTERCFLPEAELRRMLHPFLTDDPVFGRLYHGHLTELWDGARLAALRREIADAEEPMIVYGPGAARVMPADLTVYVDLPKDVGQALAARGEVFNLGSRTREPFNLTYKRLYFVDWPVLNREKRRLLPALDLFVDATTIEEPALLPASHLRRALSELARAPFRVKPWFAPGP